MYYIICVLFHEIKGKNRLKTFFRLLILCFCFFFVTLHFEKKKINAQKAIPIFTIIFHCTCCIGKYNF